MQRGLGGRLAVDDPLVEVRGTKAPHPAAEGDVVAVMDLGQVVEAARLFQQMEIEKLGHSRTAQPVLLGLSGPHRHGSSSKPPRFFRPRTGCRRSTWPAAARSRHYPADAAGQDGQEGSVLKNVEARMCRWSSRLSTGWQRRTALTRPTTPATIGTTSSESPMLVQSA